MDNWDKSKLKAVPTDLSKLSNVVDNNVVKKTVYDIHVIKVNAIDTKIPRGLVTKTQYYLDNQSLEKKIEHVDKKIPNAKGLVKKTDLNKEVAVIENKIISVTRLTTTASLNTRATEIENQIADITNLATKAALNTKVTEVESKIEKYQTLLI